MLENINNVWSRFKMHLIYILIICLLCGTLCIAVNRCTNTSGEYFVTSEKSESNDTKVSYNASGNRLVDGMTDTSTSSFHHRIGTDYVGSSGTGKNMPPYLVVYMWKRTA